MISFLLTLVHAEHKLLGPCYLYDRFCLEVYWKPANSIGNPFFGGADFGRSVHGDSWLLNPETHYKGCFTGVAACRKSGIALVCRKQGEQQYVKTYVSNSLESGASDYPGYSADNDSTDYNTFFKYIRESPKSNDYCVTLEAEVGGEQPLDEHSSFNAKYITKVRNILDSDQCKNYPASVETNVASGPVVPPMAATCATHSCTSGFVNDSTKTNAVCTSCDNAECCKTTCATHSCTSGFVNDSTKTNAVCTSCDNAECCKSESSSSSVDSDENAAGVSSTGATCATYSCTSGFVNDSTKTNAVCTSSCNNAECCKATCATHSCTSGSVDDAECCEDESSSSVDKEENDAGSSSTEGSTTPCVGHQVSTLEMKSHPTTCKEKVGETAEIHFGYNMDANSINLCIVNTNNDMWVGLGASKEGAEAGKGGYTMDGSIVFIFAEDGVAEYTLGAGSAGDQINRASGMGETKSEKTSAGRTLCFKLAEANVKKAHDQGTVDLEEASFIWATGAGALGYHGEDRGLIRLNLISSNLDNKTNDDENTVKTVRMVPGDSSAATTTTATSGAIVVAMLMYYAY